MHVTSTVVKLHMAANRCRAKPWVPAGRRYIKADFRISGAEAARLRAANLRRLLTARKLLLVLDLDHTLLNSCRCRFPSLQFVNI